MGYIWISAFHFPCRLSKRADELSHMKKKCNEDMEWALVPEVKNKIEQRMGYSDTDLFASAKNHKTTQFISYMPEKRAVAVNIFCHKELCSKFCFPSFQHYRKGRSKTVRGQCGNYICAPPFPSQQWFPRMLQ